jgi:hypothetical protein
MNPELLFELATMAINVARDLNDNADANHIEERLVEIIHQGVDAYEEHTGVPFDTSLIHAEATL